jgi:hypothetical protein
MAAFDQWLQYVLGGKRATDLTRTGCDEGFIGQSSLKGTFTAGFNHNPLETFIQASIVSM